MKRDKKIWFKAKLYGWGWRPSSWQGWAIMFLWIVTNIKYFVLIDSKSHSGSDTLIGASPFFILTTILLLAICYLKGEVPRWRWGEKAK